MDVSRDIKDCCKPLQTKWPLVLEMYQKIMRRSLFLTCTYRNEKIQQELYAQGRTTPGEIITQIDGINSKSMHNYFPALAFDVCVDVDLDPNKVKPSWSLNLYEPLGHICDELGLVWGGYWKWRDVPHIQVSKADEWLLLGK